MHRICDTPPCPHIGVLCSPDAALPFPSDWQSAVSRSSYAGRASRTRGCELPPFFSYTRITHLVFKPFGSCSSLVFCRQQCHRLPLSYEQMTQRFVNSSGPIRLQVPRPRPHARAGHTLPKACGLSHVVTLSFWCHATCQSLSTRREAST